MMDELKKYYKIENGIIEKETGHFIIEMYYNDYIGKTQINITFMRKKGGGWVHHILIEETPDYINEIRRFVEMEK